MKEFQFVANTPEGEKRTGIAIFAVAFFCVLACWLLFDFLLSVPRPWLWLVIVAPSAVAVSLTARRMQQQTLGLYTLRLDGRHLTIICPNQTILDLGEVQHLDFDAPADDNKRADLALSGSKDQLHLRLRSAAAWNGQSTAKDFATGRKAAAAIEQALAE